ncbi:MAG: hypothetical protein WCR06_11220 [bacterium]
MKHGFFSVFRMVTGAGLVVLLGVRIGQTMALNLLLLLVLVMLWFVPTLLWCGARSKVASWIPRHDGVFAAADGYLVMQVAAQALAGVWHHPLLLLGAYVFFAGVAGGSLAGAAAAGATFLGLLNGWLIPANHLPGKTILLCGGTALIALVCGMAWRLSLPLLVQMVRLTRAGKDPAASAEQRVADRIAELEDRLREMSDKRDRAQERLSEWRTKQAARAAEAAAVQRKADAEPVRPTVEVPATNDPALKARLEQVAAALADSRAGMAALLAEKQKLMVELSDLSKELLAVRSSTASANTPATPPGGEAHANG